MANAKTPEELRAAEEKAKAKANRTLIYAANGSSFIGGKTTYHKGDKVTAGEVAKLKKHFRDKFVSPEEFAKQLEK